MTADNGIAKMMLEGFSTIRGVVILDDDDTVREEARRTRTVDPGPYDGARVPGRGFAKVDVNAGMDREDVRSVGKVRTIHG